MSRTLAVCVGGGVVAALLLVLMAEVAAIVVTTVPALKFGSAAEFAFSPARRHCVSLSAARAVAATVACFLLAFPIAYAAASMTEGRRRLVSMLLILPLLSSAAPRLFVLRDALGVSGWMSQLATFVLGREQPLRTLLFSDLGVVIGLVVNTLPFCALFGLAAVRATSDDMWLAARELHVEGWRLLTQIVVPTVRTSIATAALLTFAVTFSSGLETAFLGESRCSLPDAIVSLWRGEHFDAAALLAASVAVVQFGAFAITVLVLGSVSAGIDRRRLSWRETRSA